MIFNKKLGNNQRYKAFTLAEVLITLGIIGVVAAMTIPSITTKIQDWQFKQAWKKEYSTLTQAINAVYADDGVGFDLLSWKEMPRYYCKLEKKLKILKSGIYCPANTDSIPADIGQWPNPTPSYYWHSSWESKDGNPLIYSSGYQRMSALTVDGAFIRMTCLNEFQVDVNGYKKPNVAGRDIFYFRLINPNKTTFWGIANDCVGAQYSTTIRSNNYVEDCKNGSGWGCSAAYILGD